MRQGGMPPYNLRNLPNETATGLFGAQAQSLCY
jgi:hypothetical protein